MEFVDYSGDTATITYRNIKPDWYRIDRIIDDKVIESQKILVQNNFITYLWM